MPHATFNTLKALSAALALCMTADQHLLRRRLSDMQRRTVVDEGQLAQLAAEVAKSQQRRAARLASLPQVSFPAELPVVERYDDIEQAIVAHQVVIVCGETGSGKTTQLPKICLALGRGVAGLIGHTQPRRIAARSVAARIAEELQTPLGDQVGYKVRFSDRTSPASFIKVMTDGILLAESQHDRFLNQYDTLIIDEAHERSLNIDFLLGYLKQLITKRHDLKVIVTSATIDPERLSHHFNDAPIIEVSGRTYPVEIRYRPLLAEDDESRDQTQQEAITSAVAELARESLGDILVFLSGEREIRETAEALRKQHPPHTEIVPLFARLSASEQNRIFQPHSGRRIVLATNVAETSLTVPGIKYVVDPGYARISRYSYRSKVQRLPIEKISQASAQQRSGRCGRVSAGIAIRLYSEADFNLRAPFTEPEILRTNLAAVILQMKALGFGEVAQFPFIDAPDSRMINDGYQTLEELGAVDGRGQLTTIGRQLAKLPVDPRLGRMILAANDEGALAEVLIIAAALSVQDPRERPLEATQAADEQHRHYSDKRSDFIAFLNLWRDYHEQAKHLTTSKLRQYCKSRFLSYVRLRDWHEVHTQLQQIALEMGLSLNQTAAEYAAIHRALLTGLLTQIGFKTEGGDYLATRSAKFQIFPGSALFKKSPAWVMAAEIVDTGRRYARVVAAIEPEWVETLAPTLVKHHYFEPHWEKKRGSVVAFERVTLYGLTVVVKRKVQYGPIDPVASRELMIRSALVAGELDAQLPFFLHNQRLREELASLEHKTRRQDIVIDDELLYQFYAQRLPAEICDSRSLERWHKTLPVAEQQRLLFTLADLTRDRASSVTVSDYPDTLKVQEVALPLTYHFEPGHPDDGVTVTIPLALLNQLTVSPFEWLVPGLLQEKIAALLKSLPKALRRNFVPVPDFAAAVMAALPPERGGGLMDALSKQLQRMTGVFIPHDAWQPATLPPHLQMMFRLVDSGGDEIARGRDLLALQQRQGAQATATFAQVVERSVEREEITGWDFGPLAEQIEIKRAGSTLLGFPALVAEQGKVALRLLDSPQAAQQATQVGLRQLFMQQLPQQVKYLEKNLPGIEKLCLYYLPVGRCEALKSDIIAALFQQQFIANQPAIRDAAAFAARLEQGKPQLIATANTLCKTVGETLQLYHALNQRLKQPQPGYAAPAIEDMSAQLARLIYPDWVVATPFETLQQLPRYLQAIDKRLDKLGQLLSKDSQACKEIQNRWQHYLLLAKRSAPTPEYLVALTQLRWMIEELRVSLFAQELRTLYPISPQRVDKQIERIKKIA